MTASILPTLAIYIPAIVVVLTGVFYGIGVAKNRKDIDAINDNGKWESALNIRNVEISDLKAQMLDQQKRHDATLVSLQGQITALQLQVKGLQEKNDVLANTVSGRDILVEVVAEQKNISDSLIKFDVLLSNDGLLSQFMKNDSLMMAGIEEIKGILSMGGKTATSN